MHLPERPQGDTKTNYLSEFVILWYSILLPAENTTSTSYAKSPICYEMGVEKVRRPLGDFG